MGMIRFEIKEPTRAKAEKKMQLCRQEGQNLGLVEERASHIEYDPGKSEWKGSLWLHS